MPRSDADLERVMHAVNESVRLAQESRRKRFESRPSNGPVNEAPKKPLSVRPLPRTMVVSSDVGLFPSEKDVAARLNQEFSAWKSKVQILERHGFPKIDPIMGGRYWPAVKAWWNRRYGLNSIDVPQPDGTDNFDALR